jgi:hypothetical protein
MLRKLLPLFLLSGAIASAQIPGPPPGIAMPSAPTYSAPTPTAPTDPPPDATAAQPQPVILSATDRNQVIDAVAARLLQSYILPDMAQQLVTTLLAHQKQGAYDAIADGAVLASRLTSDLQAISRDRHLRVEFFPSKLPREEGGPSAEEQEQYRKDLERTNCGFQRAEIFPGNIGYVQLNYFGPPDVCGNIASIAMKYVSHTDAIIFDLRLNHGGDPAMVALLASYLFDRPVHLDDLYNRRENKTTQYWATPEKVSASMPTQPVYVLTSRVSFSGAEQFCYDLRNLRRATLIGEKTGGAAHPTLNHRLSDHFLIAMPEFRYINSITRTDWEGQGISPDVPAAPWNALLVAQKLALARVQHSDAPPNLTTTASR